MVSCVYVNVGGSAVGNTAGILGGTLTVVDSGTAVTDSLVVKNTTANTTTNLRLDIFSTAGLTSTGYKMLPLIQVQHLV